MVDRILYMAGHSLLGHLDGTCVWREYGELDLVTGREQVDSQCSTLVAMQISNQYVLTFLSSLQGEFWQLCSLCYKL
jgi:hypothetical protein